MLSDLNTRLRSKAVCILITFEYYNTVEPSEVDKTSVLLICLTHKGWSGIALFLVILGLLAYFGL